MNVTANPSTMAGSTVETEEIKVSIRNLYKIFGDDPASVLDRVKDGMPKAELLEKHNHVLGLKDINIDMPAKRLQVIMGLSGSGKSTLIRHINRLIDPTAGEILIDGEDVLSFDKKQLLEFRRHKASMVFQKFGLLPHRTVEENVAYGLTIQGISRKEATEKGHYWIERVGLSGFEARYPGQLSGGMQQRVGLARALATDAEILLMDEAFSALDPLIRTDMQNILLDLQEELHKTIIFITHDLDEALKIADNIAILRDGEVVQQGDPQEVIMNPADEYVTDFVADINRGRHVRLRSVMDREALPSGPVLPGSTPLEESLKPLSDAPDNVLSVVNRKGERIGAVSLKTVIDAMGAGQGIGQGADGTQNRYR